MPKYQVSTDQGTFELETDSPVTSNEQMQQLVSEQLGTSSAPDTTFGSKVESASRGGIQGLTLGFSDELEAALRGYLQQGKPYSQFYKEELPKIRAKYSASKEANPATYGVSEVVGSIPAFAIAPEVSAPLKLAALGAASAAGYSEAETPVDLAKDVVVGAGTGAALGKGSQLLGKAVSKFATKVRPNIPSLSKLKSPSLSEALETEIAPAPRSLGALKGKSLASSLESLGDDFPSMPKPTKYEIPTDKVSQLVERGTQQLIGAGAGASLGSQAGAESGIPGAQTAGMILGGAGGAAAAPAMVKRITPLITKAINAILVKFPKYQNILADAMAKGGNKLPATVYALQQTDQAFRQNYQKVQDEIRSQEVR